MTFDDRYRPRFSYKQAVQSVSPDLLCRRIILGGNLVGHAIYDKSGKEIVSATYGHADNAWFTIWAKLGKPEVKDV